MLTEEAGRLETNCKITSINKGSLRGLYVISMECEKYKVEFDIVDTINIFKEGENVKMILSKDKPKYSSDDFCAHGYLFYEKAQGNDILSQISLYGLIVKIYSEKGLIGSKLFNMMDHVYFCVSKAL